jgi:hypothetical protein
MWHLAAVKWQLAAVKWQLAAVMWHFTAVERLIIQDEVLAENK